MAGTTFQELLDGVANYYGSGSDQWAQIARYGVTEQTLPIIKQVPGVTITVSNSGKYLGYDYVKPFASTTNPASVINSNVQNGAYGAGSFSAQVPATEVTNPSTGTTTMQSGAISTATGSTIATIADRASLALAGVALGTKLGKLVDSGLYAVNPDWWDEHYPSINPETWDDMATTQGGKNFIRSIFGLQNDDATMYLDERMLTYTYMMLREQGAYNDKSTVIPSQSTNEAVAEWSNLYYPSGLILSPPTVHYKMDNKSYVDTTSGPSPVYAVLTRSNDSRYIEDTYFFSKEPFTVIGSDGDTNDSFICYTSNYLGYDTYYRAGLANWYSDQGATFEGASSAFVNFVPASETNSGNTYLKSALLASLIFSGTISQSGIDGVKDNPQAHIYIDHNLITGTTPEQVLQQLKQNYPDLFKDSIYEDVPQPDGTTKRITYIPVPYPDTSNQQQPISDTTPGIDPQANPQVNPNNRTKELIQHLTDTLTQDPTPPDTGTGETPEPIVPVGEHASSLWAIYNPTLSQLNSFGAWLWDSNFVEQIKKMFNDPMQSIIGLHKVYATPSTGGSQNIKVGYLDSGVPSAVVTNQYTTVHCGSVRCPEYFGNVFDYAPYTEVQIFLPFIGIVPLNVSEVMRSTISVTYQVDVLTGACLAEVSVRRDGGGGILYTYAGNCAAQYPLSSGSYISVACAAGAVAAGAVGSFLTGNPAPLVSSLPALASSRTNVQHSGGYSGNAGAMGGKKPYLIITRPQVAMADNYSRFIGNPANHTTRLGSASGFVRVSSVHVEGMNATDNELNMIKEALEEGVIV